MGVITNINIESNIVKISINNVKSFAISIMSKRAITSSITILKLECRPSIDCMVRVHLLCGVNLLICKQYESIGVFTRIVI